MASDNDANYIKWLMTDLMVDLASAVGMGREIIFAHDPLVPIKSIGRLRVCNHSIVLSLFKLHEVRKGYGQFFNGLPGEVTVSLYQDAKDIEAKKICQFRNKYAAHIFDKERRRQKLSATPDLSGTVLPLCLIPNSALKSAPPFKSVVPKASACAGLPA